MKKKSTKKRTAAKKTPSPKGSKSEPSAKKKAATKAKPMAKKKTAKAQKTQVASATRSAAAAANDWRAEMIATVRHLIKQAEPAAVEEVKWRKPSNSMMGVPVWSHSGIICTGEIYKDKVKLTFAKGASLADPSALFNSSLKGNTRRAIDLRQGEKINETNFKALIRAAVALNTKA